MWGVGNISVRPLRGQPTETSATTSRSLQGWLLLSWSRSVSVYFKEGCCEGPSSPGVIYTVAYHSETYWFMIIKETGRWALKACLFFWWAFRAFFSAWGHEKWRWGLGFGRMMCRNLLPVWLWAPSGLPQRQWLEAHFQVRLKWEDIKFTLLKPSFIDHVWC